MYGYLRAVLGDKGRQVYSTSAGATVQEAVRIMNERGIGALLVLDKDRVAGIFTERDVLRRVVGSGLHPAVTPVAEVMTHEPLCVPCDMRVEDAMELMTNRRFRHLPVMENQQIVGMVSSGDLMRWISLHQEEHIQRMAEYITGAEPIALAR